MKASEVLKKRNLKPESKRVISLCGASAVAEAYVDILPKDGLSMGAVGIVKEGEYITFYLDTAKVIEQLKVLFENMSVETFMQKFRERFYSVKDKLLAGDLELYSLYFSAMGGIKTLTRYIDVTGKFPEHHEEIGALFNEIAEVYVSVEALLTKEQMANTLHDCGFSLIGKGEFTLLYDGKWHFFDEVPVVTVGNVSEVSGSGFGEGIVKGEVSFSPEEGKIYVTTMTVPHDVLQYKKVKAIVTDEGGILSHAAIISREMQIPTVVGTKVATKVFKDGDVLEVNAKGGIVRKC